MFLGAGVDLYPFAYRLFDEYASSLVTTLLAALSAVVWQHARDLQGLRLWARRIALQRGASSQRSDPFSACYRVERDCAQREACLFGAGSLLLLSCLLLGGCKVAVFLGGHSAWSDVLLAECLLCAGFGLPLGAWVASDAIRFGRPDRERDERELAALDSTFKSAWVTASTSPPAAADCGDEAEPATTGTMLKLGRVTLADVVNRSPPPFRPIVKTPIHTCLNSFQPKMFEHERDCVDYLSVALERAQTYKDCRKVDVLAVCVDKTMGADYVERYWRQNLDAARAGLYISRVFAFDHASLDSVRKVAQTQSNAGINAYMIHRDRLAEYLRETCGSEAFGFTVVRGVDSLDQVVLHEGVGEQVHAAAYERSPLTAHFAGLYTAIRKHAERARPERGERVPDPDRARVQLKLLGDRTLDAWRIEFDEQSRGHASMSVALHARFAKHRALKRDDKVIVTADSLAIAAKPMRVSHVHSVDGLVCRRREHTSCLAARDGDFYVGLSEVA